MSTNYNRIKVSDLETNDPDKILMTNENGELDFSDINSIKVDNYNGLDYNQEGKALDARQGKVLNDSITNKVDKVAGSRLITAAEIDKISEITQIITTVKTISSTVLATQNAVGFVEYINSLNPVLNVQPNEIVKYITTDSARVFQLNIRGRSFGIGQQPLTISDVIEITAFLDNDIKLGNYHSTRNDGNLTHSKVLSTDSNGNLKMYSFSSYPAPYISKSSFTFLPNQNGNLNIKGSFFTPTMTMSIEGHTVNHITFINDNEIEVNITTSSLEGSFEIILDNGLISFFPNSLIVVLGEVFKPKKEEWIGLTSILPDISEEGNLKVTTTELIQAVKWPKLISANIDFRLYVSNRIPPMSLNRVSDIAITTDKSNVLLRRTSDNSIAWRLDFRKYSTGLFGEVRVRNTLGGDGGLNGIINERELMIERISNVWKFYVDGVYVKTFAEIFNDEMSMEFLLLNQDFYNIKYVELAT